MHTSTLLARSMRALQSEQQLRRPPHRHGQQSSPSLCARPRWALQGDLTATPGGAGAVATLDTCFVTALRRGDIRETGLGPGSPDTPDPVSHSQGTAIFFRGGGVHGHGHTH